MRILVVEDAAVNRMLVGLMLKKMGCECDFALTGLDALNCIAAERYDLVLMDCQMPIMNGYAATRALRAWEAGKTHLPVIALTGDTLASDRAECLTAGMDGYLTKPVQQAHIQELLERYLPRIALRNAGS